MLIIIPQEPVREQLLPYDAALNEACVDDDTLFCVAAQVITACFTTGKFDKEFIEHKSESECWESLYDLFEPDCIGDEPDPKDWDMDGLEKKIKTCIDSVRAITNKMIPCFQNIPQSYLDKHKSFWMDYVIENNCHDYRFNINLE